MVQRAGLQVDLDELPIQEEIFQWQKSRSIWLKETITTKPFFKTRKISL